MCKNIFKNRSFCCCFWVLYISVSFPPWTPERNNDTIRKQAVHQDRLLMNRVQHFIQYVSERKCTCGIRWSPHNSPEDGAIFSWNHENVNLYLREYKTLKYLSLKESPSRPQLCEKTLQLLLQPHLPPLFFYGQMDHLSSMDKWIAYLLWIQTDHFPNILDQC